MKVLFIQPPHYFGGESRRPAFFPVGFGYLTARLLEEGHEVEVFDIWAHQLTKEEVLRKISSLEYDAVGITALSTQYKYVKWLAEQLKRRRDNPVVLGGALATFSPEVVLENTLVDICIISEGDVSFPNLLTNLGHPQKVNGIVYRRNGEIVFTAPQEYVQDLDSLGFAIRDRKIFATDVYLREARIDTVRPGVKVMNVTSNRGCPWSCDFCSKTFHHVRSRSIPHVRQEIEMLKEEFGVRGIFFNDELLALNKKRMYELCEAIKPLNVVWQGQARVNTVDLDVFKCMKDAGCVSVGLGIESGSQRILDTMNKKTTVEQNFVAIKAARNAGLRPIIQCIYGYSGECDETIKETIEFFCRADTFHWFFFVPTPLPGSFLYQRCIKQGLIPDEHEYLSKLEAGYCLGSKAHVNLTDFSEKEFYAKKRWMQYRIMWNYFLHHPLPLALRVLRVSWRRLRRRLLQRTT